MATWGLYHIDEVNNEFLYTHFFPELDKDEVNLTPFTNLFGIFVVSLFPRATPASLPMWTGPRTASISSLTQETTRSSSVGFPSLCSHAPILYLTLLFIVVESLVFQRWTECQQKVFLLIEFRFFFSGEASSGKHVTNMDTVRNLEWATSTCTLTFNTFGRWIKLCS